MSKLLDYEVYAFKAYIAFPARKLLNHQFELEEDYLAGQVHGILKGERYNKDFTAFSQEELAIINSLISQNIDNEWKRPVNCIFVNKGSLQYYE